MSDEITDRALALAEEFLARARPQIQELAQDDLRQLRDAAAELKVAGEGRGKSSEHVAYTLVASAFNELLGPQRLRPPR